ncbi:undecaprenyl/decaprenyl-phosphate alpha-N-acetylglucosaminyl 1-phosphate transferase [Chloroflexi bacterium TSY]|nr:undecaprenyl/decaprenyl-phosphate alpha-N-acetylglucosaminyl 1-phosphate transferase [Chloroflexi bacterium TSY]
MTPYFLMATSALLLAISGTPIIRRMAMWLGVMDKPATRKIHTSPVPLMGGAAIYIAFIAALIFFGDRFWINELVGIFVGATLVSLMGLVDDRWGLGSYVKLAGQVAAAGILIYSGVQIRLFGNWIDYVLSIFWIVGVTNALNLLDNMDGLCGGIAMIAAVFFTLLAAMSGQYLVGALAAALAGACAGFLFHNWNPAHIFMGDTGSLFLGFLLASVGIKLRFTANTDDVTWLIPIVVLIVPIFDTALVSISRLRRGLNPLTTPGKDHVSHRLAQLTESRREAVLILYLAAGAAGLGAVFLMQATLIESRIIAGLLLLLAIYGIWWFDFRQQTYNAHTTKV